MSSEGYPGEPFYPEGSKVMWYKPSGITREWEEQVGHPPPYTVGKTNRLGSVELLEFKDAGRFYWFSEEHLVPFVPAEKKK